MNPEIRQMQTIELEKAWVKQLDDRMIVLEFKNDVEIELEDAVEINKIFYSICKGKPFLSLVDARVYGSITSDAREFFAKDVLVKDIRVAEAMIINNLAIRLFARFYIKFNKPSNPIKVFSQKEEAIDWLNEQYSSRFGSPM